MAQPLLTLVEWKRYRFLIMDSPKDMNLHIYLEHLKAHKVTDMVRVCEEKEYSAAKVEEAGIRMHVRGAAPAGPPPPPPPPVRRPFYCTRVGGGGGGCAAPGSAH